MISWVHSDYLLPAWRYELEIFLVLSYLGQLALLAFLPGLLTIPFVLLRMKRFVIVISWLLATLAAFLLFVDTIVYGLFQFHLNGVVFQLVLHSLNNQFFDLSPKEFLLIPIVILIIGLVEAGIAWLVWRFVFCKNQLIGMGKWVLIVLGLCLYISYCAIIFSWNQVHYRVLVEVTRFLPLYAETLGMILPSNTLANVGESYVEHSGRNDAPLNYPLQALQFNPHARKLNLVIILIDTWRFDMLNRQVTPSLFNFSKKAWYFSQHSSGGNATGPGIFSLFYALPSSYWPAMETHRQSPALIDRLMKQHYLMKVFSSGTLKIPAFDKTVFVRLQDLLQAPSGTPYERDQAATHRFIQFINQVKQQPFFSYIHLESAHGYCSLDNTFKPFQPTVAVCDRSALTNESDPVPYFNRYKNALLLDDALAGEMIAALQKKQLLKNTVVIITGDHGEEFNDNHQGHWGHTNDYTAYQVRTPLIIYWPGSKPKIVTHATSHYDIAPTLMHRLLGCKNSASDYSIGNDLLSSVARSYLLIGGYIDLGVVEKDRITRVFSTGDYQIEKLSSEPLPQAQLNVNVFQQAFSDMRRFYARG